MIKIISKIKSIRFIRSVHITEHAKLQAGKAEFYFTAEDHTIQSLREQGGAMQMPAATAETKG